MDWQKCMNKVLDYIEQNLSRDIDYNILAKMMNCSECEFRRIFAALTQIPLSKYIRSRRLAVAAVDIINGEKIIEVALRFGYESQAAFSRVTQLDPEKINLKKGYYMSNTLETKTMEQLYLALKSYNSYMCEIPAQFDVLDEYLYSSSKLEFCNAFLKLQEIIMKMYDDLLINPQVIGLAAADKKSGELKVQTSQHISCIKKMMYSIGLVSELDENILTVNMDALMDAYGTFYPNCSTALKETITTLTPEKRRKVYESKHVALILQYLSDFGFMIENFDLDKSYDEIEYFTLSYPDMPTVCTVIKAFSMPRICRISFGIDYTKFNYRVFGHPSDKTIPATDLYSIQILPDEHKKFFKQLNHCMNDIGSSFGECESGWYHGEQPCQYIYNNKLRILQNIENGLMPAVVIKVGKKIDKVTQFIESLPEEYRNGMGKCRGCKKGECAGRTIINLSGKRYVLCNGAWWGFPVSVSAIPYILNAYKL